MSNGASATPAAPAARPSPVQDLLTRARANPLVPLLVAGAAVIALVAALLMWASSPEYRVLYSNLGEADGGRIIAELEQRNVPYRFSQGGGALLVPGDQTHKLRLQLAEQGLPQAGNVGFEIMDNQAFGISQFAEQVNFQRGLQGELTQSIESLGPVATARVHLAMAKPSVFIRDQKPAKASVVLTLHPGRSLGDGQVNAVAHMVSSSVPDLSLDNVTVVDQAGRLLSRPEGVEGGLDGTQLEYRQAVERSYRERIERILTPILGADNVRAQVSAEIDFDRREETQERFAPNQGDNPAAVRSAQVSGDYDGINDPALGIPGALSNTPPGAAPSPIENDPDADADADADADTDTDDDEPGRYSQDQVINYEVDRDIAHIQRQRGGVQRLSVAIVVNHRPGTNDDGDTVPMPLDDDQMQRINDLARQAMGYSDARGDGLEVVNSPFAPEPEDDTPQPAWWESPQVQSLVLTLGRYLLVGVAALLLFLWVLRPLIKRYASQPAAAGAAAAPGPRPAEHDGAATGAGPAPQQEPEPDAEEPPPRRRRPRSPNYDQNLKDLQEMAQEDPAMVAMIVRSWMNRNE